MIIFPSRGQLVALKFRSSTTTPLLRTRRTPRSLQRSRLKVTRRYRFRIMPTNLKRLHSQVIVGTAVVGRRCARSRVGRIHHYHFILCLILRAYTWRERLSETMEVEKKEWFRATKPGTLLAAETRYSNSDTVFSPHDSKGSYKNLNSNLNTLSFQQ